MNIYALSSGRGPSGIAIVRISGNETLKICQNLTKSKNINRIDDVRILDPGYEYSSDPTLTPEAFVPPVVSIINNTTLIAVQVVDGGKNYTSAPSLDIVNPDTGEKITNGYVEASMSQGSTSVSSVEVILEPRGMTAVEHKVYAVNNSNGMPVIQ